MLELKNLETLGFKIDESRFDEKFREKNTQFFKSFDKAITKNSDMTVYYAETDSEFDYYDLIAVEKKGVFNCIPVSLFAQYMGIENKLKNTYRELQENLPFSIINRDDLDKMIKTIKIKKETDKFLDEINNQSEICNIVKSLTNGEVLILSTIENQYGGEVADLELYINEDGLFEKSYINCYSSRDLGLGTCLCNSHPSSMEDVITPKEALELIQDYLIEKSKEEEEKEKQRKQIAQMLQLCY